MNYVGGTVVNSWRTIFIHFGAVELFSHTGSHTRDNTGNTEYLW